MNLLSILRWAGGYSSAVSYAVNDVVEAAGGTYVSTIPGNIGNTPNSSPTDWAHITPVVSGLPLGPKPIQLENGPVVLSSSAVSVQIGSITIPTGLYMVEFEVGNLTPQVSEFGSLGVQFPFYLVDAKAGKYEGLVYSEAASSGITVNTTQGPGYSFGFKAKATPVVAP